MDLSEVTRRLADLEKSNPTVRGFRLTCLALSLSADHENRTGEGEFVAYLEPPASPSVEVMLEGIRAGRELPECYCSFSGLAELEAILTGQKPLEWFFYDEQKEKR